MADPPDNLSADGDLQMPEASPPSNELPSNAVASVGQVFISYRVDGDEAIAQALQKLIQESISPRPRVYVANAGGLVFSDQGLKQQLQSAVESTNFFVGLFSEKSKDKDWLIFEAGAAWGRRVTYAPVLIDISFDDLPSMLNDLYAAKVLEKDKIERLVGQIAIATRGDVKSYFAQRFGTFQRVVYDYLRKSNPTQAINFAVTGQEPTEFDAIFAFYRNEVEKGEEILKRVVATKSSIEDKARLLALRVTEGPERASHEKRALLNAWDPTLKETWAYHYWRAVYEPDASAQRELLASAIRLATNSSSKAIAQVRQLNCVEQLEGREAATKLGISFLLGTDSSLVVQVSQAYFATRSWVKRECRLFLLLLAAMHEDSPPVFSQILEASFECNADMLAVWSARCLALRRQDANADLSLGRAYHKAGLPGLAHQAYEKASGNGINVAEANIANIHLSGADPFSALRILDQHDGIWSSADKSYPHTLRANAERDLQHEEARATVLDHMGADFFQAFCSFARELDGEISSPVELPKALAATWTSDMFTGSALDDGAIRYRSSSAAFTTGPEFDLMPLPILGLVALREAAKFTGFLRRSGTGKFRGIRAGNILDAKVGRVEIAAKKTKREPGA